MNEYRTMIEKHQQEVNKFPLGFAYGDKQFEEMMHKWGLDARKESDLSQVSHLFAGAYILKKDIPAYKDMSRRHSEEYEAAIAADKTGDGFCYEMFYYELCNHEFGYTGDYEDTLDALGLTWEQVQQQENLKHGLEKAAHQIMHEEGC